MTTPANPSSIWYKLNWFSNRQFRQAVAHSVDKDAIINDVLHGLGYPQWASVSPAAGDFHNPAVRRYEYDIERANAILDDLGWVDTDDDGVREDSSGNPITFDLTTNTGNTQRQKTGAIIHRGLQDIGIGAAYRFSEFGGLVPAADVNLRLGIHGYRLWRRPRTPLQHKLVAQQQRLAPVASQTEGAGHRLGSSNRRSLRPGAARNWTTTGGWSFTTKPRP